MASAADPTMAPVAPPITNPAPALRGPAMMAPRIAPPMAPAAVPDPGRLAAWESDPAPWADRMLAAARFLTGP